MKNTRINREKLNNVIVIGVFLIITLGLLVLSILIGDKTFSDNENRNLAQKPALDIKAILDGTFTEEFESYVQDQLPLRDNFMSVNTTEILLSGRNDNGRVYFGKGGYLFSIEEQNETQLKKNLEYINTFAENSKDRKYTVSLMVVPSAANILSDKLPTAAQVPDENKNFEYIKKNSVAKFIDVREALSDRADEYIYYRTDHHWTTLGAYYAYCSMRGLDPDVQMEKYKDEKVSDDFLGTNYSKSIRAFTKPDEMYKFTHLECSGDHNMVIYEADGEVNRKMKDLYDGSYLYEKDKYSYYLSGNNPVTYIKGSHERDVDKVLVIVKDSFSHCFIPFLAEDYDEIIAVDMRYYRKNLTEIARKYKADEVMFLYSMTNLSQDTNLVFIGQ